METSKADLLTIKMLGPLSVIHSGKPVELPQSRKARALLAYLALASQPVSRSRLCDIFFDGPNDPRGELRWCLSRLRTILDWPDIRRLETPDDTVRIRIDLCSIDAIELADTVAGGLADSGTERLRQLAEEFAGSLLDGVEVDRSPHFNNWRSAQRRKFEAAQIAVLDQLVARSPVGDLGSMPWLEKWLELSPFDLRVHEALLAALLSQNRVHAGDQHVEAAARLFHSEEMDASPLREIWQNLRGSRIAAHPRNLESGVQVLAPDADTPRNRGGQMRASLAVMPFDEGRADGALRGRLADGLTHDIITRLAKLRDLFVIARGSVYALAERGVGPEEAGRRLNVDYVASGSVRWDGNRGSVDVELVDVTTARIVWSENFEVLQDDIFSMLDEIGNSIVASISGEIETVERNRAILKAPNSLNAWEAYHRGLWHMYRFTREENDQAKHFFTVATNLDPTFARAHAGLSFTHWQSAFQRWGDRDRDTALAFESAGQSVLVDDHNPAAHWAMGRALWLRGSNDESLSELTRAVDLSPNFALGHYALSFVHSQSGDPMAAIGSADHSRHLSPFDPLLFGMLGARAMAHVRLGQFEEAAEWALKAAARPNSHAIILAIAANCLGLAGRIEEGRAIAQRIRQILPHYNVEEFLASFRFEPDAKSLFRMGARRIGLE